MAAKKATCAWRDASGKHWCGLMEGHTGAHSCPCQKPVKAKAKSDPLRPGLLAAARMARKERREHGYVGIDRATSAFARGYERALKWIASECARRARGRKKDLDMR